MGNSALNYSRASSSRASLAQTPGSVGQARPPLEANGHENCAPIAAPYRLIVQLYQNVAHRTCGRHRHLVEAIRHHDARDVQLLYLLSWTRQGMIHSAEWPKTEGRCDILVPDTMAWRWSSLAQAIPD